MIEFSIKPSKNNKEDQFIALNQLLKATQLCESGAMANLVISDRLVTLNGKIEVRKRAKIRKSDIITYDGHTIIIV